MRPDSAEQAIFVYSFTTLKNMENTYLENERLKKTQERETLKRMKLTSATNLKVFDTEADRIRDSISNLLFPKTRNNIKKLKKLEEDRKMLVAKANQGQELYLDMQEKERKRRKQEHRTNMQTEEAKLQKNDKTVHIGDQIKMVNSHPCTNLKHLKKMVDAAKEENNSITLRLLRDEWKASIAGAEWAINRIIENTIHSPGNFLIGKFLFAGLLHIIMKQGRGCEKKIFRNFSLDVNSVISLNQQLLNFAFAREAGVDDKTSKIIISGNIALDSILKVLELHRIIEFYKWFCENKTLLLDVDNMKVVLTVKTVSHKTQSGVVFGKTYGVYENDVSSGQAEARDMNESHVMVKKEEAMVSLRDTISFIENKILQAKNALPYESGQLGVYKMYSPRDKTHWLNDRPVYFNELARMFCFYYVDKHNDIAKWCFGKKFNNADDETLYFAIREDTETPVCDKSMEVESWTKDKGWTKGYVTVTACADDAPTQVKYADLVKPSYSRCYNQNIELLSLVDETIEFDTPIEKATEEEETAFRAEYRSMEQTYEDKKMSKTDLYRRDALGGSRDAMYKLGEIYVLGPQPSWGYAWINKAADLGHKEAIDWRARNQKHFAEPTEAEWHRVSSP